MMIIKEQYITCIGDITAIATKDILPWTLRTRESFAVIFRFPHKQVCRFYSTVRQTFVAVMMLVGLVESGDMVEAVVFRCSLCNI